MSKYDALDAEIVAAIKRGASVFHRLNDDLRVREAAINVSSVSHPSWAVLDRRLQALRKRGAIRYQRGKDHGWVIVEDAR